MTFVQHYNSPLGGILLAADAVGLTGLWFDGGKYFADHLPAEHTEQESPILIETKRWLDIYFAGSAPDFMPPLHPIGSSFRQAVWEILLRIPYGHTTTYGEIARQLAVQQGLTRGYSQLARPIVLRNSRYNQQLLPGSLLVEVGGHGNTLTEAVDAARLWADNVARTLLAREKG